MIELRIADTFFQYDGYHLTKAFYPNETIKSTTFTDEDRVIPNSSTEGKWEVGTECDISTGNTAVVVFLIENVEKFRISWSQCGELPGKEDKAGRKECKYQVNKVLYERLSNLSGRTLDWGILIGVRPTKVAMKKWKELLQNQEYGSECVKCPEREVVEWMQSRYGVSKRKANLAMEIAMREDQLIQNLDLVNGYSLYIGIPFCKTRCSYCSFTAYALDEWVDKVDDYLDALCKELAFVGKVSAEHHKILDTIYVGGGTPTSLNAKQLDRLLTCVEAHFPYEYMQEITVEAGRPDSITREKLEVLRKHNVGRISINPQTMQDKTLKLIGREHTVQDIYDVYAVARELGFTNINMDLIIGLPGETVEDVEDTLQKVAKLAPDSLTVHSLAMKRTSRLTLSGAGVQEDHHMREMIELAADYAENMKLEPYYLYRQKNMAGNYENVGYAEVDKAGIYNILIMEEKQSIIAVGAGATTKIVLPKEKDNIIRIENVKDVNEYMTRIDEMIARKGEWLWH